MRHIVPQGGGKNKVRVTSRKKEKGEKYKEEESKENQEEVIEIEPRWEKQCLLESREKWGE